MKELIPIEIIERKIYLIRGCRLMLDRDLAELYGVETKVLNQAVKRNLNRFPEDFMFQLTPEEAVELSRSHFVTLKRGQNIKYLPYAFTENGVAMLSTVLNSERAVEVNIQIMRTFTRLRELLLTHIPSAIQATWLRLLPWRDFQPLECAALRWARQGCRPDPNGCLFYLFSTLEIQ